jgi:ABC-type antimicrobial peptide transport system permease subunit
MAELVITLSLVVLIIVAFGAGYVPARRASQVDPFGHCVTSDSRR